MNLIPELAVIILTILWMIEQYDLWATEKREALAQKTLELIAYDRSKFRAGIYTVRKQ